MIKWRRRRRQVQTGGPGSIQIQSGGSIVVGSRPQPRSDLTSTTDVVFADPERPCHGCAHSSAYAPFPGHPSGERPCAFCVRNPDGIHPEILHPEPGHEDTSAYARRASQAAPDEGVWYDGTPSFKTPMDCYIATDRSQQQQIFNELNRLEASGEEAPPRERYPAFHDPRHEVWCCDGGPAPGGHTWTCWRWLGVAFG